MLFVLLALGAVVLAFGLVILVGAPYLPTRKKQSELALDLLDLSKGQVLYELGAGTGGLTLIAASKGIRVVAIELNPILWLYLKIRLHSYAKTVEVKLVSFWSLNWSEADGLYCFMQPRFMTRLYNKFLDECQPGAKLVSYAFMVQDVNADVTDGPMALYFRPHK